MRILLHSSSLPVAISHIFSLAIGCYTLGLVACLYPAYIGLGIHVLVTDLDRYEIASFRPQVERALAHVQQLTDLFCIEISLLRFTQYRGSLFFPVAP